MLRIAEEFEKVLRRFFSSGPERRVTPQGLARAERRFFLRLGKKNKNKAMAQRKAEGGCYFVISQLRKNSPEEKTTKKVKRCHFTVGGFAFKDPTRPASPPKGPDQAERGLSS